MAEPKTAEQLNFLTSLAYVEEAATGVQGWWVGLADLGHEGQWVWQVREALLTKKKNVFFRALPKLPLPPLPASPQFGQLVPLFLGFVIASLLSCAGPFLGVVQKYKRNGVK